ncbi:MAG: DUF2569 family protein [Acidobacteriota bacterium]|nr:DUF2569 family protein [Acidobacteriota bacterium]
MSSQCSTCGATLEDNALPCSECGAPQSHSGVVQGNAEQAASLRSGLFSAADASADAALTGIGGWLILSAIGLALAPFMNLFALFTDGRLLINPGAREYLTNHTGLYLLILFEIASNLVFILYSTGLNILFYTRRKAFPIAMIVFLAASVLVISIDHIGIAQLDLPSKPAELLRALIAAIIWIPYFLRSRRVALTFVR